MCDQTLDLKAFFWGSLPFLSCGHFVSAIAYVQDIRMHILENVQTNKNEKNILQRINLDGTVESSILEYCSLAQTVFYTTDSFLHILVIQWYDFSFPICVRIKYSFSNIYLYLSLTHSWGTMSLPTLGFS
jgi:hypothetical protein